MIQWRRRGAKVWAHWPGNSNVAERDQNGKPISREEAERRIVEHNNAVYDKYEYRVVG